MEIEVPVDEDGYSTFQCSFCNDYFKLIFSDYDEYVAVQLWCPCCGFISESYWTEEVIDLLEAKMQNLIAESFSKIGAKIPKKDATPIKKDFLDMQIFQLPCCGKNIKLRNIGVYYCPFCGVNLDGN